MCTEKKKVDEDKMDGKEEICYICSDLLSNPRIRPCIHTLCLDAKYVTSQLKPGDLMQCPFCDERFAIKEGMVGLQRNIFMKQLIAFAKVSKQILCEKCIEGVAKMSTATHFCFKCNKNICDRCCREHQKYEVLKSHRFIPLTEELRRKLDCECCNYYGKEDVILCCLYRKQTTEHYRPTESDEIIDAEEGTLHYMVIIVT